MNIGFIGAGKVGISLGIYLRKYDFNIYGYYDISYSNSKYAAKYTNSKAYKSLEAFVHNLDIIFITTNDDSIKLVCNKLINSNHIKTGQILIHTSGVHSSKVLIKAKEKNCNIYSIHPLQAFANIDKAVKDLNNTVFTIEGDEEQLDTIKNIFKKTKNSFFIINSNQKILYHAVACIISNYLVTLMDYGLSIFKQIGINETEGYKALYPLINSTINNIFKLGTTDALTGPIARGDIKTIKSHIISIHSIDDIGNKSLYLYKILGTYTLELAKKQKLKNSNKIQALEKIFKEV